MVRRPRPAPVRRAPWPTNRPYSGIAVDLGSLRTRVWASGRGVVLDVPTVTCPGTGASYPIQRGAIIDPAGVGRMLQELLGRRLPRFGRPVIAVTTPILGGVAHREAARTALEALQPRAVLPVPTARAVAQSVDADVSRPLLVVDLGAHLTEVFVLTDGAVFDAHRVPLGISDLDGGTTCRDLTDAVITMVTGMLRQDRTSHTLDAVRRGALLAGGGALRPEITYRLAAQLHTSVRAVPAPHTAAVRGAGRLLQTACAHPSVTGQVTPPRPV